MRDVGPSVTAQRVALRRAAHQLLDVPLVFDDPLALTLLEPETAAALRNDPGRFEVGPLAPYLRAFMAARSRFAEDALADRVARGLSQYVVLGAGLDTFAYRNPHPSLRVFEVDHPATQEWKRHRLAEAGVPLPPSLAFVAVDFERQTLADTLPAAGLDLGAPTFVAWLGVTVYLTHEAILTTLRFVAQSMAAGSGIVFDYGLARAALSWRQRAVFDRLAARVAAAGEPWLSTFEPAVLARELMDLGFVSVEDVTPDALNARYFAGRTDGLRVGSLAHLMRAGT
jgi:methyltransferase (TIGR00027 family)